LQSNTSLYNNYAQNLKNNYLDKANINDLNSLTGLLTEIQPLLETAHVDYLKQKADAESLEKDQRNNIQSTARSGGMNLA
jgi:hypothetical protein